MDVLLLSWFYLYDFRGFGCFYPPGPTLSWVGLLLLYSVAVPANYWVLGTTLLITIIISVLDFVIPAKGTKKIWLYGVWGTTIGLIVGILAPIPFGFLIGPLLALIGELIFDLNDHKRFESSRRFVHSIKLYEIYTLRTVFGIVLWIVWQHKSELF
jgi:uncharacterized protein YqgC (DUF456 family)